MLQRGNIQFVITCCGVDRPDTPRWWGRWTQERKKTQSQNAVRRQTLAVWRGGQTDDTGVTSRLLQTLEGEGPVNDDQHNGGVKTNIGGWLMQVFRMFVRPGGSCRVLPVASRVGVAFSSPTSLCRIRQTMPGRQRYSQDQVHTGERQ